MIMATEDTDEMELNELRETALKSRHNRDQKRYLTTDQQQLNTRPHPSTTNSRSGSSSHSSSRSSSSSSSYSSYTGSPGSSYSSSNSPTHHQHSLLSPRRTKSPMSPRRSHRPIDHHSSSHHHRRASYYSSPPPRRHTRSPPMSPRRTHHHHKTRSPPHKTSYYSSPPPPPPPSFHNSDRHYSKHYQHRESSHSSHYRSDISPRRPPPPRGPSPLRRVSPRRRSPRRLSPRRVSPRRVSPRRLSPRRPSPRRPSPRRLSPRRYSPRGPSPRRFSPRRPSPGRFSPRQLSPRRLSPRRPSPRRPSPRRPSPRRPSPRRPSPRRLSPRRLSPRRPSPRRPSPRRLSPRRPSPRRPSPRRLSPRRSLPGKPLPRRPHSAERIIVHRSSKQHSSDHYPSVNSNSGNSRYISDDTARERSPLMVVRTPSPNGRKRKRSYHDDTVFKSVKTELDDEVIPVVKVVHRRPSGLTALDALDEELDYDESMDDIEQYLQEDEGLDTLTLKSEVVVKAPYREDKEEEYITEEQQREEEREEEREDELPRESINNNGNEEREEEEEEGQLIASDSEHGVAIEDLSVEGIVREVTLVQDNVDKEFLPPSDMPPDDESDSDSEHLSAAPPISSPIRITPEPSDDHMTHLRHSAGEVKEDGEDTPIVPRLSVKERLYLSKKDIERKIEATDYRHQHKLSSKLESRLGPLPNEKRRSSEGGRGGARNRAKGISKGSAIEIAKAFKRKQNRNKEQLYLDPQEFKKGQRFAKLLNEHQTNNTNLSSRDEDLDKRISRIRSNDQKRLERDKEIRKDRQLHG